MTTITFVRHGITDHNVEGRAQGHTQNPLNELGVRQAKLVGKRLAGQPFDVFLSSDLLRARQTAEIISRETGLIIDAYDERLRERDRGQLSGTIVEDRIACWGENWRRLKFGEESDEQLRLRGRLLIADLLDKYWNKHILAVTHSYFLGQLLKDLFADETTGNKLRNTSITTIRQSGDSWIYIDYDCVEHLEA